MKLLIYAILVYFVYRLIKRGFKSNKEVHRGPGGGVIDEMVQDPFCKTYVPKRESVRELIDGQEHFFCSGECASRYVASRNDGAT